MYGFDFRVSLFTFYFLENEFGAGKPFYSGNLLSRPAKLAGGNRRTLGGASMNRDKVGTTLQITLPSASESFNFSYQ